LNIRDHIPFLSKKANGISVPAYGGGIRPSIVAPSTIKKRLNFLSNVRAALTAGLFTVVIMNLIAIFVLTDRMNTRLYVADGTPFGCPVIPVSQ
jgi:hypothetical protein